MLRICKQNRLRRVGRCGKLFGIENQQLRISVEIGNKEKHIYAKRVELKGTLYTKEEQRVCEHIGLDHEVAGI